jgi:hypothetical protein
MQQHWKLILPGAILALAIIASPFASAQSSGNFTANISTTQCTINTTPSLPNSGGLQGGSPNHTILDTYIKTSSGSGTTLLIRPSIVTGLFNNTEVTGAMETSANSAAVKVFVTLDGSAVAPDTGGTNPNGIIYDQRFQQLSSNVFDNISGCMMNNSCSIDLIESTLAAHSFDFVAPNLTQGTHHVQVQWDFVCTDNTGTTVPCSTAYTTNTAGACAGPGSITVTQTKAFSQSSGVTVGP